MSTTISLNKNLKDWQIQRAYYLAVLDAVPAVLASNQEIFACLDPRLLITVAKFLPSIPARINEITVIINTKDQTVFVAEDLVKLPNQIQELQILTEKALKELLRQRGGNSPFRWGRLMSRICKQDSSSEYLKNIEEQIAQITQGK